MELSLIPMEPQGYSRGLPGMESQSSQCGREGGAVECTRPEARECRDSPYSLQPNALRTTFPNCTPPYTLLSGEALPGSITWQ